MQKSLRIAFLSEHASPLALRGSVDAGGQNVYVDEVSRNLALLNYSVDIFTRRDHPDQPEIVQHAPGVRIVHLNAGPAEFIPKDQLWPLMPEFRDQFLAYCEQHHEHYDLIHSNFWMSGWVATELRQRLNIPVVHIFHAMGKTKQLHQGSMDSSPRDRIEIETEVIQNVDSLIAQCPGEQKELIEDYGADPAKVQIIPSAVNSEIFRPVEKRAARQNIGIDQDAFTIVYVGRMLPRKDVRNVVQSIPYLLKHCQENPLRQYPAIKLVLVGGETEEPDPQATPEIGVLQQLASDLGISQYIQFIGKRQQDSLKTYYSAGDVAVTTPWYEPFGLTPLEGMACGRPVIGSAVGGITFTIADGITGFLVPPSNPPALAERLSYLLENPERCQQMGQAARQRVINEFTWSTVARRTANLYQQIMQERHYQTVQI